MGFTVKFVSGAIKSFETLDDAAKDVYSLYPEAQIGHDGDLNDGGDRTLCWKTNLDSVDDDGQNAVAVITAN